jgi:two-component system NtrC family sensor kinase
MIQVIHLEDSLADRELIKEFLVRGGIQCNVLGVATRKEFTDALQTRRWDIILADYSLPGFDGGSALKIAQQLCSNTPFIFLSGVMGEDVAVESLKSGATDYVLKQGIKRLCPAVRRALKEAGVAAIAAELEHSRARALSSDRLSALGLMAGNIAHEINNPLAIIHSSACDLLELVEARNVPRQAVETAATRIKRTADRISLIVQSMRRLARDGSADPLERARVSEIVEQVISLCQERFRAHSVRLDIAPIDAKLQIVCREVQISQVLLNLLQNAFDAVVELQEEKWVRLQVTCRDRSVVFEVMDNGPGVPAELRARIMEPFFTTKPVGKGTGLGLSLSKTIVEEHGGKLQLSEADHHTCFSFTLRQFKEPENATEERHSAACR